MAKRMSFSVLFIAILDSKGQKVGSKWPSSSRNDNTRNRMSDRSSFRCHD